MDDADKLIRSWEKSSQRFERALNGLRAELHRANEARDQWARQVIAVLSEAKTPAQQPDAASERLDRIAAAHVKDLDPAGATSGLCVECDRAWPCPTQVWAATDRDPLAPWDPNDDG